MFKSEYDRKYMWHPNNNDEQYFLKKKGSDERLSEPRMTHKRRVKLTEDNVVIGEPLPHQAVTFEKQYEGSYPKKYNTKQEKHEKIKNDKHHKKKLISESVQTDNGLHEKSTQISKNAPNGRNSEGMYNTKPWRSEKEEMIDNEYLQKYVRQCGKDLKNSRNHSLSLEKEKLRKDENKSLKLKEKQNVYKPVFETNNKENEKDGKVVVKSLKENNIPLPSKTEYQTKYAWRDPINDQQPKDAKISQMMSSLDTKLKIYNNFISEYQRQYRPYEYVTENRYKKMKPNFESHKVAEDIQFKFVPSKNEQRRALTPPPRVSLNKKTYKSDETMNPQRMSFPHGKQKRFLTEYSANFDNKWEKLDAEIHKSIEEKAREANSQAKWFQEILELRKKAQEYRQRSRGTHFSREHLGQVYTKAKDKENDINYMYNDKDSNKKYHMKNGTHSSCSSFVNNGSSHTSVESVIIGRPKSRSISPIMQSRTAGKPTNDDSLLLDEEASHDTNVKSVDRLYSSGSFLNKASPSPSQKYQADCEICPVKKERHYTLEKYFNMNNPEDTKKMRTLDYESLSNHSSKGHVSTRSMISSSTMSLAVDTLERAKRNRDELLRQKS